MAIYCIVKKKKGKKKKKGQRLTIHTIFKKNIMVCISIYMSTTLLFENTAYGFWENT